MKLDKLRTAVRRARIAHYLVPLGWVPVKGFLFRKGLKTYDLSAADIGQIDRIEKEGLFVVNQ